MKKSAFTLVELLVVIAIIALLLAILLPALRLAREQAHSILCRSNVRTLTLAWLMYKDDHDDKLVDGHTRNYPPATGKTSWIYLPPDWGTCGPERKKEYIKKGTLWPYVKEIEVYRCPSDRRHKSARHKFAYRTYSVAGGMNGLAPGSWEIIPHTSYSEIKSPAAKLVFIAECDKRGTNLGSWVIRPKSRRWIDPFGIWHRNNTSTLGFADGRVDMQRWFGQSLIEWNLKALWEPGSFTFNKDPDNPGDDREDFEFVLRSYSYKALK
ncbi:MAG: prepilin-type N-terminal cleavage/methylation domain-containing protein [Planctomycetes bacterium]|nr:prepilin-type N-terminal cleavage/methylation domain-containing protein [Planctomycetota bacterium]